MTAPRMHVSLIAALDREFAIGKGNALPWHLPDDLKRFKALTLGKPILMGRKTAESLGRALPIATCMRLTFVDTEVDGADAFFPRFDAGDWRVVAREVHAADALHAFAFEFVDYARS